MNEHDDDDDEAECDYFVQPATRIFDRVRNLELVQELERRVRCQKQIVLATAARVARTQALMAATTAHLARLDRNKRLDRPPSSRKDDAAWRDTTQPCLPRAEAETTTKYWIRERDVATRTTHIRPARA